MKRKIPSLGIVLDCCTKPSHDLGRDRYFKGMFQEMKEYLINNGVRNIVVACPNCYKVFKKYGDGISVSSVYEFMVQNGLPDTEQVCGVVTIHDPCALRFDESVHTAVRDLVSAKGLTVEEMAHSGKKLFVVVKEGLLDL